MIPIMKKNRTIRKKKIDNIQKKGITMTKIVKTTGKKVNLASKKRIEIIIIKIKEINIKMAGKKITKTMIEETTTIKNKKEAILKRKITMTMMIVNLKNLKFLLAIFLMT